MTASEWVLVFDEPGADDEGRREVLCATGNGYMATRGAHPEVGADGVHYPGSYLAGIYNRLVTTVEGRDLVNEDLVNIPNWLPLTFRVEGGEWFGSETWEVVSQRYELNIREGELSRQVVARDGQGREVGLLQRRFTSMDDQHLAALETVITPRNWSGRLEVRSSLDGAVTNSGVPDYRQLADRHLRSTNLVALDDETVVLQVETVQSQIRIAVAARTRVRGPEAVTIQAEVGEDEVGQVFGMEVEEGVPVVVEKVVAVHTSRDRAISQCEEAAVERVERAGDYAELLDAQRAAWERLWSRSHMEVEADGEGVGDESTQMVINLHVFHLLQSVSPHTYELDAGVTPRGLHGEGYRGHVFWDELFILPFLTFRFPQLTRALLLYRRRRLPMARRLAEEAGLRGAMYPWQSGSDGREETPTQLFNPVSGHWMPDNSHRQRHVSLAIAFNIWSYYQITGDIEFLIDHGAEMFVEIARFWASIVTYDEADDRYDICGVMGPDEFHDGYPDAPGSGLCNNAYTNVMASWTLWRARQVVDLLDAHHGREVCERLDLGAGELDDWEHVSRRLRVVFDEEDRLAQFQGYQDLEELDWAAYRERYGYIGRMDLILEAEGDTTNRYKLSKQADALMLLYLLTAEELEEIFDRLGYPFDPSTIPPTIHYYLQRTTHGSTLCRVAHAWVLARSDRGHSWRLFVEALAADIGDAHGTTATGIHLGAMAGTVDLLQRCYTDLSARDDVLHLNPCLPDEANRLAFEISYRGQRIHIDVTHETVTVRAAPSEAQPVQVAVREERFELAGGSTREVRLRSRPTTRDPEPLWNGVASGMLVPYGHDDPEEREDPQA